MIQLFLLLYISQQGC